jgi:hypothetical protein
MNRLDPPDDLQPLDDALTRLRHAGWSIGDTAFNGGSGGLTWLVWGSNGENVIRAEGVTQDEAWGRTVEMTRELGRGSAVIEARL